MELTLYPIPSSGFRRAVDNCFKKLIRSHPTGRHQCQFFQCPRFFKSSAETPPNFFPDVTFSESRRSDRHRPREGRRLVVGDAVGEVAGVVQLPVGGFWSNADFSVKLAVFTVYASF